MHIRFLMSANFCSIHKLSHDKFHIFLLHLVILLVEIESAKQFKMNSCESHQDLIMQSSSLTGCTNDSAGGD